MTLESSPTTDDFPDSMALLETRIHKMTLESSSTTDESLHAMMLPIITEEKNHHVSDYDDQDDDDDYDSDAIIITEEELRAACTEDEAKKLMEEMHITLKELKESHFYHNVVDQITHDKEIRENFNRVVSLGKSDSDSDSDSRIQVVIYGLGSLQFNIKSQFQLCLAILLKRDFPHWIGEIETFDPLTTSVDAKVMKALGCQVLDIDEQCRRRVDRPTLFFMPYIIRELLEGTLETNWCASRLNKMIILTVSFEFCNDAAIWGDEVVKSHYYEGLILEHTIEFRVDNDYDNCRSPFHNMAWHFFNISTSIVDLDALLTDSKLKMMRKRRDVENEVDYLSEVNEDYYLSTCRILLRRSRWIASLPFEGNTKERRKDWSGLFRTERWPGKETWKPPYTGWIKLNFSGNQAGYGGIFHDEYGERIFSYAGPLENADPDYANTEALRKGLRRVSRYKELSLKVRKLVIEGDSVSVIRWANGLVKPPKRMAKYFKEICSLMLRNECVAIHIYKEANSKAVELANKGAKLPHQHIYQYC